MLLRMPGGRSDWNDKEGRSRTEERKAFFGAIRLRAGVALVLKYLKRASTHQDLQDDERGRLLYSI